MAVDDVSFSVEHGEIFGVLGPNGAGKTTTVECVVGLRRPDRGLVRVLGLDPRRDRDELRQQVGVQLQESQLPDKLTVGEAVELYRSFYRPRPTPPPYWNASGWPAAGARGTRNFPAARSSGSRLPWP